MIFEVGDMVICKDEDDEHPRIGIIIDKFPGMYGIKMKDTGIIEPYFPEEIRKFTPLDKALL